MASTSVSDELKNDVNNINGSSIENVISVTAIFFTVVVATISVFQFLNLRQTDEIKNDLKSYKESYESAKSDIDNLKQLKQTIEQQLAEVQIETLILKAKDSSKSKYFNWIERNVEYYTGVLAIDTKYNILDIIRYKKKEYYLP